MGLFFLLAPGLFLFVSIPHRRPGIERESFCRLGALSRRDSRGGEATAGLLQFVLVRWPAAPQVGSKGPAERCIGVCRYLGLGLGHGDVLCRMEGSSTLVMIMPEEPHHLTTKQNDRRRSLVRARATSLVLSCPDVRRGAPWPVRSRLSSSVWFRHHAGRGHAAHTLRSVQDGLARGDRPQQ
jgi:hypothetical protein